MENFQCVYCLSHDRERHLFMYFDKLDIWKNFSKALIPHIAPEYHLSKRIKEMKLERYIMGDLFAYNDTSITRVDITEMQFESNSFDYIICNHVLEHVKDVEKALNEIFRVLKPKAYAILQPPFSKLLSNNFEEEKINTDELRYFFYGQEDHLRLFSEKGFFIVLEIQDLN